MPWWVWVPTGLILGAGVVLMDRTALAMIRPSKKTHARTVRDLPFSVREHLFSSLGQPLKGWFVDPPEDRGGAVAVLVHGWGSSNGRMTHLARPLLEAGLPVFLFDVRHHGEAPEAPFVTIRHFRDDTRAAVEEARAAYPHRPILLAGHSMGGSAAILAVAEGAPVDGLLTIGAPADLWGVWAAHFDARGLPGRWIVKLFRPFWSLRAGEPFRRLRPDLRAGEIRIPYLPLHGGEDRSVPPEHVRVLAAEAGVQAVILPGEGHNELLAGEEVHRRMLELVEELDGREVGPRSE